MNTESEKPPQITPNLPEVLGAPDLPATKQDETAAILERQIQQERGDRRTERFYWIFGTMLLLDMAVLPHVGFIAIPLFLLQLIFLIGIAGTLGIDPVVVLLQRLFDKYLKPTPKDDE
ncbi:MAG: hypothetical protein ACT4O6_00485 [Reyranella sp.]